MWSLFVLKIDREIDFCFLNVIILEFIVNICIRPITKYAYYINNTNYNKSISSNPVPKHIISRLSIILP